MTSTLKEIFVVPETQAGRHRRRREHISLVTTMVVLAAGVVWVIVVLHGSCGWPWSGVYRMDGECVGVTDGSYVFHAEFEEVQKKIAEENAWVRTQSSDVTVALLNPLTATETSALSKDEIRKQLEGAYTAQHRINRLKAVGDNSPLIQLVLANEGSTENQWQPVVKQLVTMTHEDHPLVAVVGMGISISQTEQGARKLSEHHIPMVGAIITADGLEHSEINGLIRVSPSNQDYVDILRQHLENRTEFRSAILVYDSNSDLPDSKDLFTKTLREALKKKIGHLIKFGDQAFTGGTPGIIANAKRFSPIIPNICAAAAGGLDVILYAGRRGDLRGFLEALQTRVCSGTPMTVVTTGFDPTAALTDQEAKLRDAKLTVVFLERINARSWGAKNAPPDTPQGYQAFQQAFTERGFRLEDLIDDRVIMMHDAVLTAAKAVQLAALGAPAPTARDVRGQLMNLHGENVVLGAGGTVSFSYRELGAGNPQCKPMFVFQFPSSTPNSSTPNAPPEQLGPTYFTPSDHEPTSCQ